MKITAFKNHFFDSLSGEYPAEEIGSFFNILTSEFLGLSRLDLALDPHRELDPEDEEKLRAAFERLKQHEPVQYITGKTEFFGLPFIVNENVLIPRPETEELVQWIIEETSSEEIRILDIGTGSGCIAISLAKNLPNAKVSALDLSEEALKVARENAGINNVQIEFLQEDILAADSLPEKYDIIVSNPPYVRELEKQEMHGNVLKYEPALALFVKDEDPLLFYRQIAALAKENLAPGGKLYFEINQYLGKETVALLQEKNFQSTLKKDIFGAERMLKGVKP
jgi:release factor glutamine methyltransferase